MRELGFTFFYVLPIVLYSSNKAVANMHLSLYLPSTSHRAPLSQNLRIYF